MLAAFDVYRAYLDPAGPADDTAREQVEHAAAGARAARPERADEIDLVVRLALAEGPDTPDAREFVTRFQQTCGPVMAKGVEDTAFYRYLRLSALNEVGGDPGVFGAAACRSSTTRAPSSRRDWPLSMTTLSTHDTKRSEDVRARLVLLSQCPREWGEAVVRLQAPDRPPPRRGRPRPRHRAAGPADARRGLAAHGRPRRSPTSRRPPARPRRRRRGSTRCRSSTSRRRPTCGPSSATPRSSRAVEDVVERLDAAVAADPAGAEARAADDAGRRRRLPGHRAARPVARRPGQPAAGRLRRPPRASWPTSRRPTRSCGWSRPRCGCAGSGPRRSWPARPTRAWTPATAPSRSAARARS